MSFLSDTDVNKRAENLFVALEIAAPAPGFPTFGLRSALVDMDFAGVYAAAHPGVVGVGGTWNPAQSAGTATFSAGNTVVEFTDDLVGSSVGSSSYNPAVTPGCWEVEIIGVGAGGCAGEYLGDLFLYNANAYAGGRFNTGVNISFYQTDGIVYNFEDVETPLVAGDIVGIVVYAPQQIDYYLNGVLVNTQSWGGATVIPMCACGSPP